MQYYTIHDIASDLKISKSTILRALKKGDLTGVKVGKLWRFTTEDIQAWISPDTNKTDS